MDAEEKRKLRIEIEEAMKHWSANIKLMLDGKIGKGKVGHILILFPFGDDTGVSWISDATRDSAARMFRKLADHLDDRRIILPGDQRYGLH